MYRNLSTFISAVLWVMLPKCSVCLMAYAGIFSALGLGSLVNSKFALPMIMALLAVNVSSVIYLSILKKEYGYAVLSLCCAVIFIINKIYLGAMAINIATGLVLLMAMFRIRLFRLTKKDCVFSDGQKNCVVEESV